MGFYINPKDCTKEEWLDTRGKALSYGPPPEHRCGLDGRSHTCVVLVLNNGFTAAAVAYSERELQAFSDPADHRVKLYMFVDDEELKAVEPSLVGVL